MSTPKTMRESDHKGGFKVILLGNERVGKTSIINKYISGEFSEYTNKTTHVDRREKTEFIKEEDQEI